ncbi:uncharacterized protein K02A2.6-like [Sinocyclocheilus grahami]|uniref:uncharacterized protein K02A2.6-like n=1 Tax=Sinocyclocheilus grahami TaxID=75366 RepID=UPI0007AD663E|nr:PREDICTED: uncharacterized protein K02A2.6-like [Sinocyclocheilus grahami]
MKDIVVKLKVEAKLERLVKAGVLRPAHMSDWAAPIVPVIKKDGSLRLCRDFKVTVVNLVLIPEQYPLPLIEDLFSSLAGGQRFSKTDLCQAYLQICVDPSSQDLLTIVTHKGMYQYQRLPFGITSASTLFQRAMDWILIGLTVQCYLDDLLITGKDEQEHLSNLEATLRRLQSFGLEVRKDRCEFFCPAVEYLGHVIDGSGLHKAPSKVKAIVEAPAATLTHFNPALPVQLACDASPYGVGADVSHIMPSGEEKQCIASHHEL